MAWLAACASGSRPATSAPVATAPAQPVNLYARIPSEIGAFKLTQRGVVQAAPFDSLFRYRDSTRTILTVIIYGLSDDVKIEADSQKWTAREGDKFRQVQEILKSRGRFADYIVAFSDTVRFAVGPMGILEHSIATPVRYANGSVAVDMQYLYLIGGKFVKVRATVPQEIWEKEPIPQFARELALRLARRQ